ncbi:MAG: glycosyl hydrolase [Acidimicrobiales bacterium]
MPTVLKRSRRRLHRRRIGLRRYALVFAVLFVLLGATAYAIATRVAGPDGVITAGNSKASCIYFNEVAGVFSTRGLAGIEETTGVTYSCIELFIDVEPTWSNWDDPWPTRTTSGGWDAWLAASPDHQLVLALSLVPESVSPTGHPMNTAWEETCASGAYDHYAVTLARNLVAAGAGNSVIRLGKEFNGPWENDYIGNTTAEYQAWARCFAQEAGAMRSVAGARFLFDWNPNTCTTNIPLALAYPGNAYVDIIGADFYDTDCRTGKTGAEEGWNTLYTDNRDSQTSLSNIVAFAKAEGKPLSIPEWGETTTTDDTTYMNGVIDVVENNDVAYQSYFDCNCDHITPLGSMLPASTAAYTQAFR